MNSNENWVNFFSNGSPICRKSKNKISRSRSRYSTAVMSIYVPRPLTALYTLIWRLVISYFTIVFGTVIFSHWVRQGLKGVESDTGGLATEEPPGT